MVLKSNCVSTLNLPALVAELGPLVNHWDGGSHAERFIQEIKPHMPRGMRDGGLFFVRLLENCLNFGLWKVSRKGVAVTTATSK